MNPTSPIKVTTIYTFVNDTAPAVTFNISREGVTGFVDLSGATVNLYIQNPLTKQRTNTGHSACTVTNATGGQCKYFWHTGDVPVEGIYNATLKITYPDTTQESAPVQIEVASTV